MTKISTNRLVEVPPTVAPKPTAPLPLATVRPIGALDVVTRPGLASAMIEAGLTVVPAGRALAVPTQWQGDTNACGTTSLAMMLSYWGRPTTHEQIDREIRTADLPTSPDEAVRYANAHGMRAAIKTDASLEDLAAQIDQGHPVQVLIDPLDWDGSFNPGDQILHYVVVSGYDRGPDGRITGIRYNDPGTGTVEHASARDFEAAWSNLRLYNAGTGINRLMITMVPNTQNVALPADSPWKSLFSPSNLGRVTMQGLSLVVNGFHHFNLGDMLGGAIKLVGGGLVTGLTDGVNWVLGQLGAPRWLQDGVSHVGGFVAKAVDAVGSAVQTVGNAISDGAKAVAHFFSF
jgi:uncharacterized protein YvpB